MKETISERVQTISREYGDKIAVSQGSWTITYVDLLKEIEKEAQKMEKAGLKAGMRVVTVLPNGYPALRFFLASFFTGVVPLPLSPRYPRELVAKIFLGADAQCLLSDPSFGEISGIPQGMMTENGEITYPDTLNPPKVAFPEFESPVACLFATSGTTGLPKLVMLTHWNLLSDIDSCFNLVDISPEDRMLGVLPMFHVFGFSIAYLLPLAKGMTLTIVPSLHPLNAFVESLKRYRSTVFLGVPALFSILAGARGKVEFDLRPLRLLICGGDALPHTVRENFEKAFGLRIIEGYGITEASPVVSVNPSPEVRVPGSAGPVIEAIDLRIVDENGNDLPPNEVGEIILSGDPISPGYFRNPAENAKSFKKGWFYTGDLGRLDERGILFIEGRKKELIIVSGFNVYPQEVEATLLEMEGVAKAAVVGEKRALRGEMVKAYVVPQEGVTLDPVEIVKFCKKKLPPYKVPRLVEIVAELPQTVTGKVMKYLIASSGKEVEVTE
ncbi:MAG: AMP-binding protein [Candidatus Atribacteria bacterium]|nr:AMP-binding protein [Candidatus Atribacteria bacterium]